MKCETDLQVLTPVIYQHEAGSVLFSEKPWEPQCLLLCGGVDDPTTVTQLGLGKKLKEKKKKKNPLALSHKGAFQESIWA